MIHARAPWLLLLAAAATGCLELPPIQEHVCGNGVVEPDNGEDCDTPDQVSCGQVGSSGECRLLCAVDGSVACPEGWRCGVDQLCRKPSDPFAWESPIFVPEGSATALKAADFDGDGIDDVLALVPPAVSVHYFEADGTSLTSDAVIAADTFPSVGVLTAQQSGSDATVYPVHDIALNVSRGVGVIRGGSDRALQTTAYASQELPQNFHVAMVTFPGSAYVAPFVSYDDENVYLGNPPLAATIASFGAAEKLEGELLVGKFFDAEGAFCSQFAAAFEELGYVRVYSLCHPDGSVFDMGNIGTKVALPGAARVCKSKTTGPGAAPPCKPLHAVDVDHDGRLDLVIVGHEIASQDAEIYVAYNLGDGHFSSVPGGPPDDEAALYPISFFDDGTPGLEAASKHLHDPPLAIGDVNDDCALDFVNSFGIYTSVAGGPCAAGQVTFPLGYETPSAFDAEHLWTEAVIVDLNGDTLLDILVGSSVSTGITFFNGTGTGFFNPFKLVTSGNVKGFTLGDFDGDLINDLAFAEIGDADPGDTRTRDTLSIVFGGLSGGPTQPVPMGEVLGVEQIVSANELVIYPDLINDLLVLSSGAGDAGGSFYIFPGDSGRQIQAPYYLLSLDASVSQFIDVPSRSVIAELDGDGHDDVAVLARPVGCEGTTLCGARLWLAPATGDAEIAPVGSAGGAVPSALEAPFDSGRDVLMANLGKGGPGDAGTDQLVLATTSDAGGTSICVVSAQGGELVTTTGPVTFESFLLIEQGAKIRGELLAADVDGDGHDDAVLGSLAGGIAVLLWDEATHALDVAHPLVLSLVDLAKTGCFTKPGAGMGEMGPKDLAASLAAVRVGAGAARSLMVVTSAGGMLVSLRDGALVTECRSEIPPGGAVASGDFNGDRIDDLIIAHKGGLEVLLGHAIPPGGLDDAASKESP